MMFCNWRRRGGGYTMSVAHWGEPYQVQRLENVNLGMDMMAGLFICSHNDAHVEEVKFTNTRVFNTAPDSKKIAFVSNGIF